MTRHRDLEADLHPAVLTARHLRATADTWPDLQAALAATSAGGVGPITGTSGNPLPIDTRVSDVIADIKTWVAFWAHALQDETDDWIPPEHWQDNIPDVLRALAERAGHFVMHPDPVLAAAFVTECAEKRHAADNAAHPDGTRRVPTRMACLEQGCPGEYRAVIPPDSRWTVLPDLRCTKDRKHTVTPEELRRLQRWQERHDGPDTTRDRDYLTRLRAQTPVRALVAAINEPPRYNNHARTARRKGA